MDCMADDSNTELLLAQAAIGNATAWGTLITSHQERLTQIVEFRMDARLRMRIDATDVMQEMFIAATARRAEFFRQSVQPLFLWLRWMAHNTLLELHRHHLGSQIRDIQREVRFSCPVDGTGHVDGTRAALVEQLTGGATGPATAARQAEVKSRLNDALEKMD